MKFTIDSLVVKFGRRAALSGVSFEWKEGALGLTGSNGSGKSTLLGVLAGTIRPHSGTVVVADGGSPIELGSLRVGFVPQSFEFPRGMRIVDFVRYAAWLQGVHNPEARANEALAQVGLDDVASRRLGHASGGMVRRAGLAAALVGDPQLVILDEPTTGIDPEQRAVIRGLLQNLAQTRAVVLSSHIAEDLEAICATVVILDAGRLAFAGTTERAKTLAGTETFEGAIVAIPQRGAHATAHPGGPA